MITYEVQVNKNGTKVWYLNGKRLVYEFDWERGAKELFGG